MLDYGLLAYFVKMLIRRRITENAMADIVKIEGGKCHICGHNQKDHEGNTVCDVSGCECTIKGSF